jgi:hypothetical protein
MTNFLDGAPAASVVTEDDDTIELELSESAMQMLSQAAAPTEQPCPSPGPALKDSEAPASEGEQAPQERRPPMSTLRFAILLGGVAAASALLTAVTYLATTRIRRPDHVTTMSVSVPPAPVMVAQPPPPSPSMEPAPTRFVNPFDRKEVFEFPAGTTEADAREAVAELLSERARERQSQLMKSPRRNGKTADRGSPVIANGITPRS